MLAPKERGLDRALNAIVGEVMMFASATEAFAQRNLDGTVAESLDAFALVVRGALLVPFESVSTYACASATL